MSKFSKVTVHCRCDRSCLSSDNHFIEQYSNIDPSSVTISLPIPGKANKLVHKANKNKLVLISLS